MHTCIQCKKNSEQTKFHKSWIRKDGTFKLRPKCRKCYYDNTRSEKNKKKNIKNVLHWREKNTIKYFLTTAKRRAKNLNIDFSLSEKDIIIPKFCPILDFELRINGGNSCPTIDRINNDKGYIPNNIVIISFRANSIKNDANFAEIEKIYNNFKTRFNIKDQLNSDKINSKKMEIINSIKKRNKKNNFECNLNVDDIVIPVNCPILNIPIIIGNKNKSDNSPSIDRINNFLPYTRDNIRIISWRANRLKNNSSYEEYKKLYLFYKAIEQSEIHSQL